MADSVKFILDENEIPKAWYNIVSDLPEPPAPVMHPGTGQPVGPDDLAPLFTMAAIMQEVSAERQIDIPEPVRDIYRQWRPSPLYRAYRLEAALDTPARIYYKYEGVSPAGSHKPNTAVAQAFYCREEGIKRISTETGAGQWGSSLALAGSFFGLEIEVFMVRVSYDQKPYRRAFMETFGATCHPSPSNLTEVGKKILADNPDSTGSLGIAISEAVEAGLTFPFIGRKLRAEQDVRVVAVEPANCPSLTKGKYAYDFGDTGQMTPLVKMHTLGSSFVPPSSHAGGLRYHGMAPLVSQLVDLGQVEPTAYSQTECFDAGVTFAKAEGILPAPEANHAVKGALVEAMRCKEEGESRAILFNLCGHGYFDMQAYMDYSSGKLADHPYDESEVAMALAGLPSVA